MCDYAYMIDGVLDDQAYYYTSSYDEIQQKISKKAALVQDHITLESNATISAPLMKNFSTTQFVEDFLYSVLTCVIVFLAFLSAQLLYSLMLSDVDVKTYEYGMLRALGF